MDNKYFKLFNRISDVIQNPAKTYFQRFLALNSTINFQPSTVNPNIMVGTNSGVQICNYVSGSASSVPFKAMQSILRGDKTNLSSSWVPVSSSTLNLDGTASSATFLSFNRQLFGDKLSIWSDKHPSADTIGFRFSGSAGYYHVYSVYDLDSIPTVDISSNFTNIQSNFGLVIVTASAPRPDIDDVHWDSSFSGLFFGQLGTIMLYNEISTPPVLGSSLADTNLIYQQSFHSETYFCRITNEVFNASTNRTWYTFSSDINKYINRPGIDYTSVTSIGLYNDQNQLLAIAKLSNPVLKYIDSEVHAKVVLEY